MNICCEICKRGLQDGVTLYRSNPKGLDAIWRCELHSNKNIDRNVLEIVHLIEQDGKIKNETF
jgi:hypothetical protein